MLKKVTIVCALFIGLGSVPLEASQPGRAPLGRQVGRVMELPDFGEPYNETGWDRQQRIAERVEEFVRYGAFSQEDSANWIRELKKHLVQCHNMDLDGASLFRNSEHCSLNQFVNDGIEKMCRQQGLSDAAKGRCALIKEAFRVAADGWPIIGKSDYDKELLTAIQQCINNQDEAIFEGRCAYIEHKCGEVYIDVTDPKAGKRSIEGYLLFISGKPAESARVCKLKKAIASGQVKKRGLDFYVTNRTLSLGALYKTNETYVTWARAAALHEQGGSGHTPLENDWEDNFREGQERGANGQSVVGPLLRSAGSGMKKYRNFLYTAFGAVTLAAIAGALWFKLASTDRREVIVRR